MCSDATIKCKESARGGCELCLKRLCSIHSMSIGVGYGFFLVVVVFFKDLSVTVIIVIDQWGASA